MKAKALKRLTRVETLLKDVLDQYRSGEQQVVERLNSAKTSISKVKQAIFAKAPATTAKKAACEGRKAKTKASLNGGQEKDFSCREEALGCGQT